jgi:hypothetical protein
MSSRSSDSEPAYLGKITVTAFSIVNIVAGEVNHPLCLLWRGQDLLHGAQIVVVIVVVRIQGFSVLREVGRVSGREWLADGRLKADDLTTSSTAATPGRKKSPSVNVPEWSLYPKFEGHSDKLLDNLTSDALHASTDCSRSPLTELEPAPKDSETPVTERLESFFFGDSGDVSSRSWSNVVRGGWFRRRR